MDNLQQYFKSHEDSISKSDENLLRGDDVRFEARWDEASRSRIKFRSQLKRRKKPLWKVVAFPLVASLALIFGVRMLMRPLMTPAPVQATASAVEDTLSPGGIYREYCQTVADITVELAVLTAYMDDEVADKAMSTLDEMAYESVPYIDQLEGMDDSTKVALLEDYSTRQIARLDNFIESFKKNAE